MIAPPPAQIDYLRHGGSDGVVQAGKVKIGIASITVITIRADSHRLTEREQTAGQIGG